MLPNINAEVFLLIHIWSANKATANQLMVIMGHYSIPSSIGGKYKKILIYSEPQVSDHNILSTYKIKSKYTKLAN